MLLLTPSRHLQVLSALVLCRSRLHAPFPATFSCNCDRLPVCSLWCARPGPDLADVYITDPPDLQSTVRAMHHACRLSCFVSCFGCHASLAHVLFAAGKPTFSRRSACLESVFYVIYVTLIMHDDSASGDDILRVNLCFGT